MRRLLLTAAFVGTLLTAPAVFADERDDRIAALEAQLQMLAAEVDKLKQERASEKAQIAAIGAQAQEAVERTALIEPAAGVDKEGGSGQVKVEMKPAPKFTYGDFSFQPFGRIHLDYAFFDDDRRDHPDGAKFRRTRLGVKGTVAKDFGYKVELDFANEQLNLKDVYIHYTGFENTDIRLGNVTPFFGLEQLTSSNYITFLERSAPIQAFALSERIGLAVNHGRENWSLAAGVYNDDASRNSSDDEAWYVGARGTLAPLNTEQTTWHIGAAAGHRKPDQATDAFDFETTAENSLQTTDSVSASFGDADGADLYGLESAFVYGPLSLQGEYFLVNVDRNSGNPDLDFSGAYAQAAWTITGERRPYVGSGGKFDRIVPQKDFDPAADGWGAWEVAARYSTVDVTDGNVAGGEIDNYTLGVNWYLNKHMRFMGNYILVDTDQNAVTPNDDPRILLFRAQVDF